MFAIHNFSIETSKDVQRIRQSTGLSGFCYPINGGKE